MKLIFILKFSFILTLLLIQSCVFPNYSKDLDARDDDLYNRVGFPSGNSPTDIGANNEKAKLANKGVVVVDDYYYRSPELKRAKPRPKRVKRVLRVRYEPSSRYYNNPYSFKPPAKFPYFDSDQYYIPPRASGEGEVPGNLNNNKLY